MKNKGRKEEKHSLKQESTLSLDPKSQKSNIKSILEPHNEKYAIVKSYLGNDHKSYKIFY